MLPLTHNSLTAQSIDAKIARRQQRYASTYNISYVHQAPPPPTLVSDVRGQAPAAAAPAPAPPPSKPGKTFAARHEIPTMRSLSEILRDAEADAELQGEGYGRASVEPQPGMFQPRFAFGAGAQRRLRRALLGGTAAAILFGGAGVTYYAWGRLRAAGGAAGTVVADSRSLLGLTPVTPQPQPQPDLGKTPATALTAEHTATAPSAQDGTAEMLALQKPAQPAVPLPVLPIMAETALVPQPKPAGTVAPEAATSGPAAAAESIPAPPQAVASDAGTVATVPASKPFEAVALPSPAAVPVVTITARPAPGHGGAPATARPVEAIAGVSTPAAKPVETAALASASPAPVVTSGASPPAGPTAQPDVAAEAPALPPGFTVQQMTSTMALVDQMALLVHDMHDENVKYRAEVMTLTGTVQAKASDFEKRLRLAEARSSIAAAIDTAREPALAPSPAAFDSGSAAGEARPAVRAASLPRGVRDYRIRRASYDYAELVDPNAPLDQQVPLEVVVGDRVPGVGRVKAITVLGGAWVVRTDHGIIQ